MKQNEQSEAGHKHLWLAKKRLKRAAALAGILIIALSLSGCEKFVETDVGAETKITNQTICETINLESVTEIKNIEPSEDGRMHEKLSNSILYQGEVQKCEPLICISEALDFDYPNDPLTVENLLEISTEAKIKLAKCGEMSVYNSFGLLDIDFDGLPEIFLESGNLFNYKISFYSLKKENFCEKLFETNRGIFFELYAEHYCPSEVSTSFYVIKKGERKNIAVKSYNNAFVHGFSDMIFEISDKDGKWLFEEKFYKHCISRIKKNNELEYNAEILRIDDENTDMQNFEQAYATYNALLSPVDYLYEGITYYGSTNVDNEEYLMSEIQDNYDELYSLYSDYLKLIL